MKYFYLFFILFLFDHLVAVEFVDYSEIKKLSSAKTFESNNEKYEVLSSIIIIEETKKNDMGSSRQSKIIDNNSTRTLNQGDNENKQEPLAQIGKFQILKKLNTNRVDNLNTQINHNQSNQPPIFVRNNRRKKVGLVTGEIEIFPKNWFNPAIFAQKYNLEIVIHSKKYNFFILKGQSNESLIETYLDIQSEPQIKQAILRVVEDENILH